MPGLSVLFWNLNDQPLEHRVGRLAVVHAVDVVCLAECSIPVATLTAAGMPNFTEADQSGGKLRVLSRLPRNRMVAQHRDRLGRWLIYRVRPARTVPDLFLAVAHLPSKRDTQASTQAAMARYLATDIRAQEDRWNHRRTVVVGDLNMNPFEEGVAGADALHGVMTLDIARTGERDIQGRQHAMFYNPMWGVFGDRTPGPPGTYYRAAAETVNYFWSTFDQVLVRPEMAEQLKAVAVLGHDGTDSLLTRNGLPDQTNGSDHLPLLFRLEW